MKQILVYSDSLSWGLIPLTRQRLAFHERWPGALESALLQRGHLVRVIEDCLNGRRTLWEDPYKPGRKGLEGLAQRIESHSPLDWVVLMLGTNDLQNSHQLNAWQAAQGVGVLVQTIRQAPIEPGMPVPQILVVAPPRMGVAVGPMAFKFDEPAEKSAPLAECLRVVCQEMGCAFFDANDWVSASPLDGVHLDAPAHKRLAQGLAGLFLEQL